MSRERPCMLCNEPLDNEGNCTTPGCVYNPDAEGQIHDTEWQYDESMHQNPEVDENDEVPVGHGDVALEDLPDGDLLEGDFEDEQPPYDPEAEQKDAGKDQDTLDISQEDLPEQQDAPDEECENPQEIDQQVDLPDDQPQQDEGQGEADEDDDPDLPPRPRGCNGDCQPGEVGEDGDPCPHCTAKSFKEEMQEQGKENQAPEQMEEDWQNFLDNWMDEGQGQGQGDQSDEDVKDLPEQGEQKMEDRQAPDIDADDDDLPPRPQGCNGDCQPADQYDMDADPCPHCTAKSFRDEMQRERDLDPDVDPEELADKFQDFLKDWQDQQEKGKQEQGEDLPEQNPDEINEAPPQDELEDGEPKDKGDEKKDEKDEKKIDHEDESEDFKRVGTKMTVTQEKRFDNLMERIEKKVEGTFGQTAEDIFVMAKQEGQFQGEEISQSIQITSRGVTYWVTLSAAKEI